jgi:hypothetical protein
LAILAGLFAAISYQHFGAAHGTLGPGLGVYAGLVAGLLMVIGGLLIRGSSRIEALLVASTACFVVAASVWGGAALAEPAPLAGGAAFVGGSNAWLAWPNDGTTSEEKRKVGYETCAAQSMESLARLLNALNVDDAGAAVGPRTIATAHPVARGYARYFGNQEELYEGCLQAFRDRR